MRAALRRNRLLARLRAHHGRVLERLDYLLHELPDGEERQQLQALRGDLEWERERLRRFVAYEWASGDPVHQCAVLGAYQASVFCAIRALQDAYCAWDRSLPDPSQEAYWEAHDTIESRVYCGLYIEGDRLMNEVPFVGSPSRWGGRLLPVVAPRTAMTVVRRCAPRSRARRSTRRRSCSSSRSSDDGGLAGSDGDPDHGLLATPGPHRGPAAKQPANTSHTGARRRRSVTVPSAAPVALVALHAPPARIRPRAGFKRRELGGQDGRAPGNSSGCAGHRGAPATPAFDHWEADMLPSTSVAPYGHADNQPSLRERRQALGMTQLDLSLEAQCSPGDLPFLREGRPS